MLIYEIGRRTKRYSTCHEGHAGAEEATSNGSNNCNGVYCGTSDRQDAIQRRPIGDNCWPGNTYLRLR